MVALGCGVVFVLGLLVACIDDPDPAPEMSNLPKTEWCLAPSLFLWLGFAVFAAVVAAFCRVYWKTAIVIGVGLLLGLQMALF
jgi:hypothetical protein